jgi:hypothetical protein
MEAALVGKMNRYSEAFVASRMQYSKNGNTFIACNYGQIPTLISEEAEMITVSGGSGMIVDGMIPVAHFFSCLGDRYEDLGPMKYVPVIDFGSEPQLLESLQAGTANEPSGSSEAEGLTGEDWATLAKGPCLVFIIVAAADGKIDNKEMGLFGGILQSHEAIPSEIFSKILGIAKNNVQVFCQDILTSGVSPAIQLLELGSLIHSGRIPRDEADLIARGLCGLGMAIASASGGFLGFGSKISKEEAAALRVLELALMKGSGK